MDTETDVQYKRRYTVESDRTGSRAEARVRTNIPSESQRILFDVVVGGEDVSEHKPAPQGIEQAMTALALPPSETLYVDDTTIDAETAARAGVAFLAVLSGVTPRHDFSEHSTVGIVDDLGQLLEILA
jgi:phosphoglycolate phosphatase